jgi:hypothetical protein
MTASVEVIYRVYCSAKFCRYVIAVTNDEHGACEAAAEHNASKHAGGNA